MPFCSYTSEKINSYKNIMVWRFFMVLKSKKKVGPRIFFPKSKKMKNENSENRIYFGLKKKSFKA